MNGHIEQPHSPAPRVAPPRDYQPYRREVEEPGYQFSGNPEAMKFVADLKNTEANVDPRITEFGKEKMLRDREALKKIVAEMDAANNDTIQEVADGTVPSITPREVTPSSSKKGFISKILSRFIPE